MLSINELQSTIEDDELCDTLADMKQKSPNLFPKSKGKINVIYKATFEKAGCQKCFVVLSSEAVSCQMATFIYHVPFISSHLAKCCC